MNIDLETYDGQFYTYHPLTGKDRILEFKVKALCNAFVMFSKEANPERCDPVLQVLLGISSNMKSAIGRDMKKPDKAVTETPTLLTGQAFRGFWISYVGSNIQVGKEHEILPFLSWTDPAPIDVNYWGVCTGYGVEGEWIINDVTFKTPGSLEGIWRPMRRFHLEISVQAEKSACIALTSGPNDTLPMYEIVLGGWGNKGSAIRYNKEKGLRAYVDTPGILSAAEPRQFHISFSNGLVRVTRGEDCVVLMEWQDSKPFHVSYFGVRTTNGASGRWNIRVVSDLKDKGRLAWWTRRSRDDMELPPDSVVGGQDAGTDEFVGRYVAVWPRNIPAVVPGKIKKGRIYYVYSDEERENLDYDCLTGTNFKWVQITNGKIPPNAVVGGCTTKEEVLYIGRQNVDGEYWTIGKVCSNDGILYVSKNRHVYKLSDYEILVQT